MTPRHLLPFLGCVVFVTGCGCSVSPAGDRERLQGAWRAERVEIGGKIQDDEAMRSLSYAFDGDKLIVEVGGSRHEGTFSLDASRMPHQIDLKPAAGNKTDQAMQGIYSFESGNNLRVCFSQKSRPGGFFTNPGMDAILFELRRTPVREALVKMSATSLVDDCRSNSSVASAKFKDQVIEVTGTVASTKDGRVNLAAGGTADYVECTFNQNYKSELFRAMKIRPDQRVTLRGTFNGAHDHNNRSSRKRDAAYVHLRDCEVVDTAAVEDK
jgi:uncharacterized protein (TIGR03067 family)